MANPKTKIETKVRDVVCGKEVDPKTAMYTSNYDGQTYYFCSEACKREFDENPQQYAVQ